MEQMMVWAWPSDKISRENHLLCPQIEENDIISSFHDVVERVGGMKLEELFR